MANSLAIIVVLTLMVSLMTREFRTFTRLELSGDAQTSAGEIEARILDSIKTASSDQALAETISQIRKEHHLAPHPPIEAIDFDTIRRRLRFAILPPNQKGNRTVLIEYLGSATKTERELVNSFAERVSRLAAIGTEQAEEQSSFLNLANQVPTINELSSALHLSHQIHSTMQTVAEDLESHRFGMLNPDTRDSFKANEVFHLESQIAQRYGEESDELALFHREFADFFVERVESMGDSRRGPFRLTSAPRQPRDESAPRTLGELHEMLTSLPISELNQNLERLYATHASPILIGEAKTKPEGLIVKNISNARQEPVGPMSSRGVMFGLVLCALGVGWVVSAGISPRSLDRGILKPEEVGEALGIPVVAEVRPLDQAQESPKKSWPADLCLRFSENIVLLTVVLLSILALTNPEIRQSILQHPLHAITNILWSVFH
ncbi:MAG: hypothetical protein KF851_04250 [Pirellulaceae bacterium]|nr:hypothetical protein [Pirellulaceae bacterium]